MPEPPDMNAPVTHGQLHAALEIWGGALLAVINEIRNDMREFRLEMRRELQAVRLEASGTEHSLTTQLRLELGASEQRLLTEMARHANANQESLSAQVAVVDQKYADLPARVTRLETRAATKRTRR